MTNRVGLHWGISLLFVALSCGGESQTRRGQPVAPLANDHAPDSLADLRDSLAQAIVADDVVAALQSAADLEVRGETLGDSDIRALVRLVDRVPLSTLPELHQGTLAFSLISLRRALMAEHTGDVAGAARYLLLAGRPAQLKREVARVRARLRAAEEVDFNRIAVLLPMSGPHRKAGEELWAGIQLAHKSATSGRALVVEVYDTKGTEEGARLAAQAASRDKSVVAIGPAGRMESRAAAGAAFENGLPIALLAPESSASNADAGVFRMVVSPSFEATQAAFVAVELGYRLVAVMAPRDELGREQAAAFAKAARGAGAQVVRMGSYGPDVATLERDFRDFLNLHVLTNDRLRQHLRRFGPKSWKSFSPEVAFDLLYIPDSLERGALVASYLPFFNVELRDREDMNIRALKRKHGAHMPRVVQLLAGSAWDQPSLSARGGAAVEGALLVSMCPGGMGTDLSALGRRFAEDFEQRNGRAPSRAAAAAYDAMVLVMKARERAAKPGAAREEMQRALRSAAVRDGLCGSLQMTESGQVEGQIEVLRVESGSPEIYEY